MANATPLFGTHGVDDLLRTSSLSVIDYGEDRTWQGIMLLLEAHNALFQDKYGLFVDGPTTDRRRRYGGAVAMTFGEVDEYGTADAQKVTAGSNVDFPLKRYERGLQWTYTYLLEKTPADLVGQMQAIMDADVLNMDLQVRTALFNPTNYTFDDRLVDNVALAVKALVNADSAPIPPGPDGTQFDAATHTHYLGTATLAAANIQSLITTVAEHYRVGRTVIYINSAQEAAVRAFTGAGEFLPYMLQKVQYGSATTIAMGTVEIDQTYNRAIGIFGTTSAEVWVKPWIPANYMAAIQLGVPKPLTWRIRNARTGQLNPVYENEMHPLRCRLMEREFGIGVWERTSAAVLRTNNATYAAPTLT
jgi:hypothetical protein